MKRAFIITAALAVTLSLVGCSCHTASSQYAGAQPSSDNSGYQSGSSSKLGGKMGHAKHRKQANT